MCNQQTLTKVMVAHLSQRKNETFNILRCVKSLFFFGSVGILLRACLQIAFWQVAGMNFLAHSGEILQKKGVLKGDCLWKDVQGSQVLRSEPVSAWLSQA